MIVFIALVITAAVAAAVLISTSNTLQQKASETGSEATQEVSANLFIRDIIGGVDAGTGNLDQAAWYLSLAPGAQALDLSTMVIRWRYGSDLADVQLATDPDCDSVAPTSLADGFCVRDVIDTGDADLTVISGGDRVRIEIFLAAAEQVPPRAQVDVLFIPEAGSPTLATFQTPATLGNDDYVALG